MGLLRRNSGRDSGGERAHSSGRPRPPALVSAPLEGEFVVIEESIGRFVMYPADAVPVRLGGRDKQGAVPPLGWPVSGKVITISNMRF